MTEQAGPRPQRLVATFQKPTALRSEQVPPPEPVDAYLGGLVMGYQWPTFFIEAGRDHEAVGFAGYPLGGITVRDVLFGPVQRLCKGQKPEK